MCGYVSQQIINCCLHINDKTTLTSVSFKCFLQACRHSRERLPFEQELLQLEDRLGSVSRGAVQTTIERFTFPHKYKKVLQMTRFVQTHFKHLRFVLLSDRFYFFSSDMLTEKASAAKDWGGGGGNRCG